MGCESQSGVCFNWSCGVLKCVFRKEGAVVSNMLQSLSTRSMWSPQCVCVCTCFATLRGQSVHRAFVGTCLSFGYTKHQSIDQMLPLIVSLASNSYSWVHEFLDYASLSRVCLSLPLS